MLHGPKKIDYLNPNLSKITRPIAAIKSLRFALLDMARQMVSLADASWWCAMYCTILYCLGKKSQPLSHISLTVTNGDCDPTAEFFGELLSMHTEIWLFVFVENYDMLSHWGRVTHKCVSKLNITVSDNDLSPSRAAPLLELMLDYY